ncbi:hypothetical protein QUF80_07840 [Desulfococcaceae bacterium HSG8]|nr:hypothetical protein [Desulfococcaceae bacterium HSG8]
MSLLMIALTGVSLAGLLAISVLGFVKYRNIRSFIIQLAAIAICSGFLYFFFYAPGSTVAKGDGNKEVYFVIVLYFFMIMGMFAHYAYNRFSQPKEEREQFDFSMFIAPVFASPIVFIPLLAAMQNADVDLANLTTAKMMVFFVAFENGFFWKEYFDNRRGAVKKKPLQGEAKPH